MEGKLVELVGLPDLPGPTTGKVVEISEGGKYVVETFEAVKMEVVEANLKEYTPPAPESGGFDVAWPQGEEEAADFAVAITELLKSRKFCVVQLFMSSDTVSQALDEAGPEDLIYKRMRKDFEGAYLGKQYKCKTSWMEGLAEEKEELESVLDLCDLYLSNMTKFMIPLAPFALEFTPYSRTNAMVRMPFQNNEEEARLRAIDVDEDDITNGLVDDHIQFLKRRRLCMLMVIESSGGEITLIPKDPDQEQIVLPITKGKMIVFRHDEYTYIYAPVDKTDLVMQAWVLDEPDTVSFLKLEGDQWQKDEAQGLLSGPLTPDGRRTNVFGISPGLPGNGHGGEDNFWCALASGTDGYVRYPMQRGDIDVYYKDEHSWVQGWTYTVHGGFVGEDIYAIDYKLFEIPEEECFTMAPAQKHMLEKAYEATVKTGYTKESLKGKYIGVYFGHSGDDWSGTDIYTKPPGCEDVWKVGYQNRAWGMMTSRVAYTLGIRGPQALCDTACSSSLVAYGVGHTALRDTQDSQNPVSIGGGLNEAIMGGCNMIPGPGNYINLCGPHMLSVMGRCFTFDQSADGFERGEGTGSFFVKNETVMSIESTASMIGACLNQDGRSASMTAPNGPSQQECIRGSMREAMLTANQVTCAECHGTGTALGDPIEVGALRGVMQDRVVPILQTSAKTHCGHLEASAGMAGVIKCIMMCSACAGSPNCHLLTLNPHLDVNGYPTLFCTEISDYGGNSGYSGVSSFGFGGANARADIFAKANKGHHRVGDLDYTKVDYVSVTCPFDDGPMHWTDGRMVPASSSKKYKKGCYKADAIRDEFASYDYNSSLYKGQYQLEPRDEDEDGEPDGTIYAVGSWDQFHDPIELERQEESNGKYIFLVTLGDTRCERFQLRVEKDPYQAIYPFVNFGSSRTRVVGPDDEGQDKYWLIDGRDDEVKVGTVYKVTLQWGETPTVTWQIVAEPAPDWAKASKMTHSYQIRGTWTGWRMSQLMPVSEAENLWDTQVRIGMSGREEFNLARDYDELQLIYPARSAKCYKSPVCGPDELCNDKAWVIRGKAGEVVDVKVQLVDAHVTVTVTSPSMGNLVVESAEGPGRHSYYLKGSFTHPMEAMAADAEKPGVFRYRGFVGEEGEETFQVLVDGDPGLALYPEVPGSEPGKSIVKGPCEADGESVFTVTALKVGAEFDVIYDRTAIDKRKIIRVEWVTDRYDANSLKESFENYFFEGALMV